MAQERKREPLKVDHVEQWRWPLGIAVSGILAFETLTGLSIYLLPFSIPNQFIVLIHTGIGLLFIVPAVWYQFRHWLVYRSAPMTHIKLTGYMAIVAAILCVASGVVLTVQALFGTKIGYAWDRIHIVSTLALIAFTIPHIVSPVLRNRKARRIESIGPVIAAAGRYGWGVAGITVGLFAVVGLLAYTYEPVRLQNTFPPDYTYAYGEDRPFAPSLAQTNTGGAFDPNSLAGSQSCGTAGCHSEILKEWQVSAHRYAAMDAAFQAVQTEMGRQNGPESTRYCGGCHDPISLFSGTKNLFVENLTALEGYQEGVSCIVCHAIEETDIKGNANYVIHQPRRYIYALKEGGTARFLRDFLIRAYPRHHVESLQHRMFKSPEFCAACHKQFIDQEVNNVGWVQLQNQYDNWRKSRWNHPGDPTKTIECRECHMPLVDSSDPARGDPLDYNRSPDDDKHRNHRFIAANQFIPALQNLPGAQEQIALTERWLRGETEIPEIADKWASGPAVPLQLIAPAEVTPGQSLKVEALITNNKVGHDFPTGPLDIIQCWVELIVEDEQGKEIFSSGKVDERHFIQPGSFIFKAEAVDQYGNLIDRHNLWEMVGVRYKRALFPGFSDKAEYLFACPATYTTGEQALPPEQQFEFQAPKESAQRLTVSAKLLYRKVDQFLLDFLFGKDAGVTAPVTVMSEAYAVIRVVEKAVSEDNVSKSIATKTASR